MNRCGIAMLGRWVLVALAVAVTGGCQPRETVYAPRTSPARPASPLQTSPLPSQTGAAVTMRELPTTLPAEPVDPASASGARTLPIGGGLPTTGRPCRVHIRRDAMGLTGMAPLPLNAGSPGARALQFDGTLQDASDRWVVLRATDGRVYWFPADVILTIEFTEAR